MRKREGVKCEREREIENERKLKNAPQCAYPCISDER